MEEDDDDRVPVFGTWRAIYGAVLATAVIAMGLVAAFSAFPF